MIRAWRLTDRDIRILVFLTLYGAAIAEQVRREFFGESVKATYRRLRALEDMGVVKGERVYYRLPQVYRVTEQGARLADMDLPPPRNDLFRLRHVLEIGEVSHQFRTDDPMVEDWITERELRRDKLKARREKETGMMRPGGKMGRTPDGLLILTNGDRIAVELELSPKRAADYRLIFSDYERQVREQEVDGVRFLFSSRKVMHRVQELSKRYPLLGDRTEFSEWAPIFMFRR